MRYFSQFFSILQEEFKFPVEEVADATPTLNISTGAQSMNNDHQKCHFNVSEHSNAIKIIAAADTFDPRINASSSPATIVTGTVNSINTVDSSLSDDSNENEPNKHIADTPETIDVSAQSTHTTFVNKNLFKDSIQKQVPKIKEKKYRSHVTDDGRRLYTCIECGRSFYRLDKLELHIKHVHEGIRDQLCDQCGKPYATSNELQAHIRTHTGKSTRSPHSCKQKKSQILIHYFLDTFCFI